jgi:hypothetical protein
MVLVEQRLLDVQRVIINLVLYFILNVVVYLFIRSIVFILLVCRVLRLLELGKAFFFFLFLLPFSVSIC